MSETVFMKPIEEYTRKVDPIGQSIDQYAQSLMLIDPELTKEEAIANVRAILKEDKDKKIKDPEIEYFERNEFGDRERKKSTISKYIYDSLAKKEVIAATFTTYKNPEVEETVHAGYIENNIKLRGTYKKQQFKYGQLKNAIMEVFSEKASIGKKNFNNAFSGALLAASTPLANSTGHSTLTSTCRSTSAFGNANNEKILAGNRHYWCTDIVLNNIISIISNTDYAVLERVMTKYNLHYPTVQETIEVIEYSTKLYTLKETDKSIIDTVNCLNAKQRAAFVYTGDLYHLRVFNDEVIRDFFTILIAKQKSEVLDDPVKEAKTVAEDELYLAHAIHRVEMRGFGKETHDKVPKDTLSHVVATAKNISQILESYSDFIQCFFITENVPASIGHFPSSLRRVALVSDTDSTIFTVQEWMKWFSGEVRFDTMTTALSASVAFFASQCITHILGKMSANFGVRKSRLKQIKMKNEYEFILFAVGTVAKHYLALMSIKEGGIYEKFKREVKGVHYKSSGIPITILEQAIKMMDDIMYAVYNNAGDVGKISIIEIFTRVANIERSIRQSIKEGGEDYFKAVQIKVAKAYTLPPNRSPYGTYLFWEQVFADKYGTVAPPPYMCIKVSTSLANATQTKAWLETFEDPELKERMRSWLVRNNKTKLPTVYIPTEALDRGGIPDEILRVVDVRRMIADICNIFYLIIETLNFYFNHEGGLKLISDYY